MYIGYRKAVLSGVAAAAILGAGGTALAVSAADTTNGKPAASPSSSASPDKPGADKQGKGGKHERGAKLRRIAHAQIVTKDKDGKYVTRYVINGTVTAVSSTSVTVRAGDSTSKSFRVASDTRVAQRSASEKGRPAKSTISKIAKGDTVLVVGTGTSTVTAKHIVEIAK